MLSFEAERKENQPPSDYAKKNLKLVEIWGKVVNMKFLNLIIVEIVKLPYKTRKQHIPAKLKFLKCLRSLIVNTFIAFFCEESKV